MIKISAEEAENIKSLWLSIATQRNTNENGQLRYQILDVNTEFKIMDLLNLYDSDLNKFITKSYELLNSKVIEKEILNTDNIDPEINESYKKLQKIFN